MELWHSPLRDTIQGSVFALWFHGFLVWAWASVYLEQRLVFSSRVNEGWWGQGGSCMWHLPWQTFLKEQCTTTHFPLCFDLLASISPHGHRWKNELPSWVIHFYVPPLLVLGSWIVNCTRVTLNSCKWWGTVEAGGGWQGSDNIPSLRLKACSLNRLTQTFWSVAYWLTPAHWCTFILSGGMPWFGHGFHPSETHVEIPLSLCYCWEWGA